MARNGRKTLLRNLVVGAIVGLLGAGIAAIAASFSYVTAAGDRTAWGVRVFERFGIEKALANHLHRKDAKHAAKN